MKKQFRDTLETIKRDIRDDKSVRIKRTKELVEASKKYRAVALWGQRCIDCGTTDPLVLDFFPKDDRPPKEAGRKTVNQYKGKGNINMMIMEMEDYSIIRCLNCQAKHLADVGLHKDIQERKDVINQIKQDIRNGVPILQKRSKIRIVRRPRQPNNRAE